mmetsp:Transcript_54299/g.65493  ORF Transcript_54299/g.65493 Transcript_54299/m.65493 type:complete len:653 (-) Transcript_54299:67-2025(-)
MAFRMRAAVSSSSSSSSSSSVAVQLDYYMSPQFAGVASALANDIYTRKGLDVTFLPTCAVGWEQRRVRDYQNENPTRVTVGSVEQNIFVPELFQRPELKVTAVGAMFQQSPLCIASLPKEGETGGEGVDTIGAHEDTVALLERIFPDRNVVASPRASKTSDLRSGKVDGIQAYTTTEVPALRRYLGYDPVVTKLEGLRGAKLGYGQVLFTTDECLADDRRDVLRAFYEATFEGWHDAIRDPDNAIGAIREAKRLLSLDEENNDHWFPSDDFEAEMLRGCNDYVKGTFLGDRYGVIDADRWNEATAWLLQPQGEQVPVNFGLDTTGLWRPSSHILPGHKLAQELLASAKSSAESFYETQGRRPRLAVVTVGELPRYKEGERRLGLYSDESRSWFSKSSAGAAHGIDVTEVNLEASGTTTDDLLSEIYKLTRQGEGSSGSVDGIQVMYPLPAHIDSRAVYNAISPSVDVDGVHYIGQSEVLNGKETAATVYPPVTPAAVMMLLEKNDIAIENKRVLVIGRSPIVGSPLAHMLREKGGVVTVAHSKTSADMLQSLVSESDIIVCGAGKPGLVKSSWINTSGCVVINVGTTYDGEKDGLVSDVEGDLEELALASNGMVQYSPVPGGVGPLSLAVLFDNVVNAAWNNIDNGASEKLA